MNALDILIESGPVHAEVGTADPPATSCFAFRDVCVGPGLYEVEFGATLT